MIINQQEGESFAEFIRRYRETAEAMGMPWFKDATPDPDAEPYQDDPEDDE